MRMWPWRRPMQLGWKSVTVMRWRLMGPVAVACIREKISEGSCVVHCGAQINPHDLAGQ